MHSRWVLVVEDDTDIRETTVEALNDHGYQVMSAVNGREALERLRSASVLPCLIFLDLMMPVMNGREFREEQVLDEALSKIPVIVVSAYADAAKDARALGVAGCLDKPVKLSTLLGTVARFCAPP